MGVYHMRGAWRHIFERVRCRTLLLQSPDPHWKLHDTFRMHLLRIETHLSSVCDPTRMPMVRLYWFVVVLKWVPPYGAQFTTLPLLLAVEVWKSWKSKGDMWPN